MDKVAFPRVLALIFVIFFSFFFFGCPLVDNSYHCSTLVEFVVPVPLIGYFVNHSELFYGILSCVFYFSHQSSGAVFNIDRFCFAGSI